LKDTLNFPLFEQTWGADEELLLLEGIEMYGFGNWGDVSDHVGTKTSPECKQHYFDTYINVTSAPLPVLPFLFRLTCSGSNQYFDYE
jgi:transcriptional adapter 2-alpha